MIERPILFSAPMVQAILAGRKTQTRRIVKKAPTTEVNHRLIASNNGWNWQVDQQGIVPTMHRDIDDPMICPYGQIGDCLIPAMEIPSLGRNYCADVFGRIWSRARNGRDWLILKGAPNSKGYLTVTPSINGKYKTRTIHDLVAEAFYGDKTSGMQVRHLDGNQLNNQPDNLDYGTQEQNWSDRLVNGVSLGGDHHNSKLSIEIVEEIRNSTLSQRKLAAKYGVSQSTIWNAKNSVTWQINPTAQPANYPRWASRIQLEITNIRVERLKDISEEDALAEGIDKTSLWVDVGNGYKLPPKGKTLTNSHASARHAFSWLWREINGLYSWSENPWVWVITFKVIQGGAA